VGGEFAKFRDFFWREDEPWVVLQLPSGRRTAAPASWTDLPAESFPRHADQAKILPAALLEMARHCQNLQAAKKVTHSNARTAKKRN
jgi:hypothetical protein